MAGPSYRWSCDEVQPVDEDELQHFVSHDNMQLALPSPNHDERFVLMDLDVLPLQSFDPVLEQLLDETCPDTSAPIGEQPPAQMFNAIPQPAASTQLLPGDVPNGGRVDDFPARNTRGQRQARLAEARRPSYAGDRGGRGCGRGRRGRGRVDEHHRVHIESERNRRHEMSELYEALRMMLPSAATLFGLDQISVVTGAINFIATLEVELERLQANAPRTDFQANGGLVCVDHTSDATTLTAVTTWPAPGSDPSAMASFLGTHVAVHVCGQNCHITISSSHRVSHLQQYTQILMVLFAHHLEVLTGSIDTRGNTVVYTIACQAHEDANLLSNDLHAALQSVVNEFIRSTN